MDKDAEIERLARIEAAARAVEDADLIGYETPEQRMLHESLKEALGAKPSKPPRIASSLSAKVARLTAELQAIRDNRDEWAQIDNAEIARLKAALEAERAACDEIRSVFNTDALKHVAGSAPVTALQWCHAHDARRSSERAAQENGR